MARERMGDPSRIIRRLRVREASGLEKVPMSHSFTIKESRGGIG
ncbi:MAG: hypothetical protein JWO36_4358 [Myxococcales bacterium]|nr:hypothetical protein [Myxococcales bacterium]